jgi:hypothetical protein
MMKNFTKIALFALLAIGLGYSSLLGRMKDIELDPGKGALASGNYAYWTQLTGTNEIGIRFHFDMEGEATVKFYDMQGREVMEPVSGQTRTTALYEVSFDQNDIPNGVYFAVVTNNGVSLTTKFMVSH